MLLEEFQSQLKIIAEVQIDHSRKLDALLEMVANSTENIEFLNISYGFAMRSNNYISSFIDFS